MEFKDLPKNLYDKIYAEYHTSAAIVRGNVLNAVTALEMSIDLYITDYFTDTVDKSEELMNLIISPRMSFESKVQAFMVLIEQHNPRMLQENPTISNDLITRIIVERNVLAHYPLDTTEWGLKKYYDTGDLTFFKFKNTREGNSKNKANNPILLTNTIMYNDDKTSILLKLVDKYHKLIAFYLDSKTAPPPAT